MSEGNATMSTKQANREEKDTTVPKSSAMQIQRRKKRDSSVRKNSKSCQSESASSSDVKHVNDITSSAKSSSAGKSGSDKRSSKRIAENVLVAKNKRQKNVAQSDSDSIVGGGRSSKELNARISLHRENEDILFQKGKCNSRKFRRKGSPHLECDKQGEADGGASNEIENNQSLTLTSSSDNVKKEDFVTENVYKQEENDNRCWKPFEKALYEKGLQIFGCSRLNLFPYACICGCFMYHMP